MTTIDTVDAWEVLDSRGSPTVRVRVTVGDAVGSFTVPAGASTGTFEAQELRDGEDRYAGQGVRTAVTNVTQTLGPAVIGRDVTAQRELDRVLRDTDGTETLSRLGANAVLGVSGAVAHAGSAITERPLYEHLSPGTPGRLPLPLVNIISGGLHAAGGIDFQDFMIVPIGAETFRDALELAWEVRHGVRDAMVAAGHRPLVADEGGFAPSLENVDEAFEILATGIHRAGFVLGDDVAYAIDVAATHFHTDGTYQFDGGDRRCDTMAMVDFIEELLANHPIVAIEDPLAEDDWAGWEELRSRVNSDVQLIGDDLLVTHPVRLSRAVDLDAVTAVLLKPNQAGTLSRTIEVSEAARRAGLGRIVSARSGETCDTTIADLAVACDTGQIKIGSLARSERLAKYNRLLEIDREGALPYAGRDALAPS